MKKLSTFFVVVIGLLLGYILFFIYLQFDSPRLIHYILEPEKETYMGLGYLGYVYLLYSLIWILVLSVASLFVKQKLPLFILIAVFIIVGVMGACEQFNIISI